MARCFFNSIPADRICIESEPAFAFAADRPSAECDVVVVPQAPVPNTYAPPTTALWGVSALVSDVRERPRTGLMPGEGFIIAFVNAPSAAVPEHHDPRRSAPDRSWLCVASSVLSHCGGAAKTIWN